MLQSLEVYRVEDRVYELVEGVQVGLRPTRPSDAVYIIKISTERQSRAKGAATEVLKLICEAADEHRVELVLTVEPFDAGGLDTETLVAWYKGLGFEGDAGEMIRHPAGEDE